MYPVDDVHSWYTWNCEQPEQRFSYRCPKLRRQSAWLRGAPRSGRDTERRAKRVVSLGAMCYVPHVLLIKRSKTPQKDAVRSPPRSDLRGEQRPRRERRYFTPALLPLGDEAGDARPEPSLRLEAPVVRRWWRGLGLGVGLGEVKDSARVRGFEEGGSRNQLSLVLRYPWP